MAQFSKAYAILRPLEGAYSNDPNDRGGETYKGIARKKQPAWPGWELIDAAREYSDFPDTLERPALREKLRPLVFAFYKETQWDTFHGDLIESQAVAEELLEAGVNLGLVTAGQFLQRALNHYNGRRLPVLEYDQLEVDGAIGPKTRAVLVKAILLGYRSKILAMQNALQLGRYESITRNDGTQKVYSHGWGNRG